MAEIAETGPEHQPSGGDGFEWPEQQEKPQQSEQQESTEQAPGEEEEAYEAYDDDIDEDDDEIQVTIGDIKPTATFDLSKAAAQRASAQKATATQPGGATAGATGVTGGQTGANKGIDLDAPAFIGNVPVFEYNVDSVADEDKPWRKPGADITDYFNYGFNEDTWRVYCDRQRALRNIFGEGGQATVKMLSSARYGNAPGPRSIPSVLGGGGAEAGGDNGTTGRESPAGVNEGGGPFSQPPPQFVPKPGPRLPSTISVIGTIDRSRNMNKPDQQQPPTQPQQPQNQQAAQMEQSSAGQQQQQQQQSGAGGGGDGQPGAQGGMPFGFPPFGFPRGSGPGGFRPGGNFNPAGGAGGEFNRPPGFFGAANPMMAAALASSGLRLPPGMMPPPNMSGPGGSPGNAAPGRASNPADLIRLLQSNPALAQQVLALGGVGARPPMGLPLGGAAGVLGGDDKPGRTPSPRGSTPSSSPEREVGGGGAGVQYGGGGGYNDRRRSRSRSPVPSSRRGGDDQGGRRIGVLGGARRDYDRRGGDQWDRRRDKDSRDRRDRSPDRRRGRDRDDRGRRGDKD